MARISKAARDWVDGVAIRIATRVGDKAALKRIKMGTAFIAHGMPDGAFCVDSADVVVLKTTGEPSTSELRDALGAWWRANAPDDPAAIPPDIDAAGLPYPDAMWCAAFRRARDRDAANILSVMRRHAPDAFKWVWENEPGAVGLCRARGWAPVNIAQRHREWSDPVVVQKAVNTVLGIGEDGTLSWPDHRDINRGLELLRAVLTRWCPENLHMVPDE